VVLLVMGLAMQMIVWPDALCETIAAMGFRVVRFDNRDVGESTRLSHLGMPKIGREYVRYLLRLRVRAPYRIDDMADDTAALIDALRLGRVHLVGASMGGMIAQNVSARFPAQVASLASIMSTTGRRSLPQPSWKVQKAMLSPPGRTFDESVARMMRVLRLIGSRTHPPDDAYLRDLCERHVRRSNDPAGGARQLLAIAASGDRTAVVQTIRVPTLVMHGDEDPLIPLPAGRETARVILDAGGEVRLSVLAGMGHDLPLPLLPAIATELADHFRSAGNFNALR
jgi:pimeloyl-ACP methyl ester carboxylesterase